MSDLSESAYYSVEEAAAIERISIYNLLDDDLLRDEILLPPQFYEQGEMIGRLNGKLMQLCSSSRKMINMMARADTVLYIPRARELKLEFYRRLLGHRHEMQVMITRITELGAQYYCPPQRVWNFMYYLWNATEQQMDDELNRFPAPALGFGLALNVSQPNIHSVMVALSNEVIRVPTRRTYWEENRLLEQLYKDMSTLAQKIYALREAELARNLPPLYNTSVHFRDLRRMQSAADAIARYLGDDCAFRMPFLLQQALFLLPAMLNLPH